MYNFGSIPFFASNNNLIEKNPEGIPICIVSPSLSGDPTHGSTLSVVLGEWAERTQGFRYEWFRDNQSISTTEEYTVVDRDLGYNIKCVIKAFNPQGDSLASTRPVLIIPREQTRRE